MSTDRDDEDYHGMKVEDIQEKEDLAYDTWKDNQAELYSDLKSKINQIKATCERWRIKFEELLK